MPKSLPEACIGTSRQEAWVTLRDDRRCICSHSSTVVWARHWIVAVDKKPTEHDRDVDLMAPSVSSGGEETCIRAELPELPRASSTHTLHFDFPFITSSPPHLPNIHLNPLPNTSQSNPPQSCPANPAAQPGAPPPDLPPPVPRHHQPSKPAQQPPPPTPSRLKHPLKPNKAALQASSAKWPAPPRKPTPPFGSPQTPNSLLTLRITAASQ